MLTDEKPDAATPQAAPTFVDETVMAPIIGLSVATLQRDRRTDQRIPFLRIRGRCLYHPATVIEALKQYEVGGPSPALRRRRTQKP